MAELGPVVAIDRLMLGEITEEHFRLRAKTEARMRAVIARKCERLGVIR